MDNRKRLETASPSVMLGRLMRHHEQVQKRFCFAVNERRLLLLLLAYREPVGTVEVRKVVRTMEGSKHYNKVQRLVHNTVCYRALVGLYVRGALRRTRVDRRAFFVMEQSTRDTFGCALADVDAGGWQ